ncbi:excisionase family DNA-binding protein [uncultured Zoogloea sp.]|uniref:excisionase family DNA-binding protein n=1 Tax=uncultured Zoogloea sp. TaxID=160237 RepID=UPI002629CF3E|nr:excisionase family DNA-binding protein [uncultured Zoogloea sp.]
MTTDALSAQTCSTREAARLLGISVRTAQLWVEDGRLQAWKTPGGHRRILMGSVGRLLDEQQRAGMTRHAPFGVLVLRENPQERQALQRRLEEVLSDCVVVGVGDGFEGLIRMGEMAPKVLITDLGVTGLDFFRMINALITHARDRAMLVVVLVASEADKVGVRQRLPDEVVIVGTPLDSSELTVMVRAFLRNWRRENERAGQSLEEGR